MAGELSPDKRGACDVCGAAAGRCMTTTICQQTREERSAPSHALPKLETSPTTAGRQVDVVKALADKLTASAPSTTPRICSRGGAHEIDQCHKCGAIFAASAIAPNGGECYGILNELDHRGRSERDGEMGFSIRESEWKIIRAALLTASKALMACEMQLQNDAIAQGKPGKAWDGKFVRRMMQEAVNNSPDGGKASCSSFFPDEVTDKCIRCGGTQTDHAAR